MNQGKQTYKFWDKILIQKHNEEYSCKGCFFIDIPGYPCVAKIDDKFIFPCNKDIIFIEQK
jgi:hypothetical protein